MNLLKAMSDPIGTAKQLLADAKAKLLKIDENHNGIPDITELETKVEGIEAKAKAAGITEAEVVTVLAQLFPRETDAEKALVKDFLADAVAIGSGLQVLAKNAPEALH